MGTSRLSRRKVQPLEQDKTRKPKRTQQENKEKKLLRVHKTLEQSAAQRKRHWNWGDWRAVNEGVGLSDRVDWEESAGIKGLLESVGGDWIEQNPKKKKYRCSYVSLPLSL